MLQGCPSSHKDVNLNGNCFMKHLKITKLRPWHWVQHNPQDVECDIEEQYLPAGTRAWKILGYSAFSALEENNT